nr:immunoglobulin heavy chain junction region [Macaca mulatta]MOX14530.1 immunoglobulin heavy chain junction region [Macaca mulatta]MOX14588.1 immunoglobulin heavy chain junction region [Macaca mulatta]MOX14747.1 immunoglobulin heavy chain junction region [Macaca mulatta]MOX14997.1 immunoglobulin heavy chain junction region [Macaca mulatta]
CALNFWSGYYYFDYW